MICFKCRGIISNIKDYDDRVKKMKEEEKQDIRQNIIDHDLYEELSEEEMHELVEEARERALQRAAKDKLLPEKSKRRFPKWIFWLIALAMIIQVTALLPQTFSLPAFEFLSTSAKLSGQDNIKTYKQAVVVIEAEDSKGTGFAYSEDGMILTNYHVVEGEEDVTVIFPDQGMYKGEVKETYPGIDLAVVSLDAGKTDLPYLPLAEEEAIKVDEPIYIIGNPLQFTGIANEGHVLGEVQVSDKEKPVMMLDAPVYKGNSGSPVINLSGEVIGVVYATLHHQEEGRVGLFIPIDYFSSE